MNNESPELKSFRVECKTQHGWATADWKFFNDYTAKSKGDAVKQARRENYSGGAFDGRNNGLVWFRAIESS